VESRGGNNPCENLMPIALCMRDGQQVIQRAWELGGHLFLGKEMGSASFFTAFDGVLNQGTPMWLPRSFCLSF
jgi:hypothetical protein